MTVKEGIIELFGFTKKQGIVIFAIFLLIFKVFTILYYINLKLSKMEAVQNVVSEDTKQIKRFLFERTIVKE